MSVCTDRQINVEGGDIGPDICKGGLTFDGGTPDKPTDRLTHMQLYIVRYKCSLEGTNLLMSKI